MRDIRRRLMAENAAHRIFMNSTVQFEDEHAKAMCLDFYDTDGDGRISYDDLSKVTDFKEIPAEYGNDLIKFNEFKYFTGLTSSIWNKLINCPKIESIEVPIIRNNKYLFQFSRSYSNSVRHLVIPEGFYETIGTYFAQRILVPNTSIVIPASITGINQSAFSQNKSVVFIFKGLTPPTVPTVWQYKAVENMVPGYAPDESVELYKANEGIMANMCSDILPLSQYTGELPY